MGPPKADDEAARNVTDAVEMAPEEFARLLREPAGRRRLRERLPGMPGRAAAGLAACLVAFRDDFDPMHRDRTTPLVVAFLRLDDLLDSTLILAAGNSATAFWERLLLESPEAQALAIEQVFRHGEVAAREYAVHALLLDPLRQNPLPQPALHYLLQLALADADDEVRGLSAEFAANNSSDMISAKDWVLDAGERARAAAWKVAFERDPAEAVDRADELATDLAQPVPARRSALIALGVRLRTAEISPLLACLVDDPSEELALDAASLLWRYHRTPEVAQAAAGSRHPAVREIALHLLDPTRGSPEAGGYRPGAAEQGYGFYEQIRRQMDGSGDRDR